MSQTQEETKVQEVIQQKTLQEFGNMPKQNMLLNLNPIMMNNRGISNEEKLYKLRNYMEDPSNKLDISPELTVRGDVKAQIDELVNSICQSILDEDKAIKLEIKQLDDNKISLDQIQNQEVELSGISYTSILMYLNEIGDKNCTPDRMSHKFSPG
jgi:hypothetical protein